MATYVLVHGAWGGGWKYARVAQRLRARGHTVFTPTLTGCGDRSHLLSGAINLTTHVTDIVNVIRYEDLSGVVLAGHSYGGMVITGVADRPPDMVAALVYLDAFMPEDGKSLFDLNIPKNMQMLSSAPARLAGCRAAAPGAEFFGVNEQDAARVDAARRPASDRVFTEKIRLTGKYRVGEKADLCARRRMCRAKARSSRSMSAPREGWEAHALPAGTTSCSTCRTS